MRYFRNSENLIRPPPLVRTPIQVEPGLSGQGGQTRPASDYQYTTNKEQMFEQFMWMRSRHRAAWKA